MLERDTLQAAGESSTILIVDALSNLPGEVRSSLKTAGYTVYLASSWAEARGVFSSVVPSMVILERSLSDGDGLEICRELKRADDSIRLILMSGDMTDSDEIADGLEAGADAYLVKPFGARELLAHVISLATAQAREMTLQSAALDREESLQTFFQNGPEAIVLLEGEVFTDANHRALEVYGCESKEEMTGRKLWDYSPLVQPDGQNSRQKARAMISSVRSGKLHTFEWQHIRKDGTEFLAEVSLSEIQIQEKQLIQAIVRDMTERRRAEGEITMERQRLASIIEGTNVATWEWDVQTGWCRVDEKWANIMGYSLDEISPVTIETWERLCHPDDLKISGDVFERHFSGELDYYGCEVRMRHRDGSWVWIHDRGKLISRTEDGKPLMVMGTHTEITQRKQAEEALARSEERLSRIMSNAKDMIFRVSLEDGRYEFVNDAALEITGHASETWTQTPFLIREILHPDWQEWFGAVFEEVSAGRIQPTYEYQIIHAQSGATRWINQRNVLIFDDEGKPVAIEGLMTDVTESKEIEEELRLANNAKDEFLAVMSHDLRSPLNPILGFTSLLLETASGDDLAMLESIQASGERMLVLIDSLLEFARLDRSAVAPSMQRFNLLQACGAVFDEVSQGREGIVGAFNNGDTRLSPIDETLEVFSDRSILTRILANLLQNAFKYTEEGSVTFTIGQVTNPRGVDEFRFVVEDTGIGIDEAMIPSLFEPFTQADRSYERATSGVGLGLAICNKLVGLLGGEIEATSQLGLGSRFTVTLPLEVIIPEDSGSENGTKENADPLTLPRALRVLIVDDEAPNALMAEAMVKRIGSVPIIAGGGRAAIELCQKEHFDVILMDLRMPEVNGFQATERIRAKGQLNAETPIVAATANVSKENEDRCKELGMSGFLRKPMRIKELFDELSDGRTGGER